MTERFCEICGKRPQEVEYIEVVGGTTKVLHLCSICAEREANGISLIVPDSAQENISLVCPECGVSLSYVRTSLKLGCPTCYNVFEGVIKDLLSKLQGSSLFKGKEDLKTSEEKDLVIIKHRLKKELDKAVINEEFERAAHLRDQINKINEKLKWFGLNPLE